MRIGMMMKWKVPPMNVRVSNEAETLAGEGHEVHFLVEGRRGQPREETVGAVRLVRGVRLSRIEEILQRYTFNFTYRDPRWAGAIARFVRERAIDVLHVNDIPLLGEAVRAGRRFSIPVVADLHENYPAGLQVWYTNAFKKATIYSYDRWSRYERGILRRADAVVVVIEEARERVAALGVPLDKIRVVPNTVRAEMGTVAIDTALVERYRGRFVVSYIGGFAPHRGLDAAIRALPMLRDEVPGILLVLVGGGNDAYRRRLERTASDLGCGNLVEWAGWQPQDAIWSFIEASDICLVPHARNPHTDTTIPNKIFQYLMRGRPVIVSDCPPLRRIAEETGGGLVFTWNSPAELAERILRLYRDPEMRRGMAEAGRRAVLERFTWERTSGPLVELYRSLSRGKAS